MAARIRDEGQHPALHPECALKLRFGYEWQLTSSGRRRAAACRFSAAGWHGRLLLLSAKLRNRVGEFVVTFSNAWFQHAGRHWERMFDELGWRNGRPMTVVEIGSFEGQSTLWILKNLLRHPDSRIHCIDSFAGGIEFRADEANSIRARFDANIFESGAIEKVVINQGLSRDWLVELRHAGVKADFVYVDGSHQAPDVLEDLVLSFRLLKVGGLMICDDYLWFMENMNGLNPGREDLLNAPKVAIDAFVNIYIRRLRIIHDQPLYQFAFFKAAD